MENFTFLGGWLFALFAVGFLVARMGHSSIPAYIVLGVFLQGFFPAELSPTFDFLANLGMIFLLFFLGLEFSFSSLHEKRRQLAGSGGIDLLVNLAAGAVLGWLLFGTVLAALLSAGVVGVSSSAIVVKGLIDFKRVADRETPVVLGILVAEDLAMVVYLPLVAALLGVQQGTEPLAQALLTAAVFVGVFVALARLLDRHGEPFLGRLEREPFGLLLMGFLILSAGLAEHSGLSLAIGAFLAGSALSTTGIKQKIEESFHAFRDIFAALFFLHFGMSLETGLFAAVALPVAIAVAVTVITKMSGGYWAGRVSRLSPRRSLNVGAALVAHGEFSVVIGDLASEGGLFPGDESGAIFAAFTGLYVLSTALIGIFLMRESKRIGRILLKEPSPRRALK